MQINTSKIPLKICFILPSFQMGGIEKVFVELANNFVNRYQDVSIIFHTCGGSLDKELSEDVVQVPLIANSYKSFIPMLIKYIDQHRPDVLLTSVYAIGMAAIIAKIFTRHKPKVIVGAHNRLSFKVSKPDNWKDRIFLRLGATTLLRFADSIVCVSKGVAEDLRQFALIPHNKLVTIYNPVVSQKLKNLAAETVNHPWFNKSSTKHQVIISVGRLVPQKGFEVLLQAFSIVKKKRNVKLLIIGDGPELNNLQKQARSLHLDGDVIFFGQTLNPYKFLSKSDLFVMASHWEGFGNVLVEALACGCPAVSTDCKSGPREILDDGKFGELVSVSDPVALASAICRSLSSENQQIKKQLISRAEVFSVSSSASLYAALIASCMLSN